MEFENGPMPGTRRLGQYCHNLEFSSFPLLCKTVYDQLKCRETSGWWKRFNMPYCNFLHVNVGLLQAAIIGIATGKDNWEGKKLRQLHENSVTPEPIADYISRICTMISAGGEKIYPNIPEIAIPRMSTHKLNGGHFGPVTHLNHNVYECYISPLVTRNFVEATYQQEKDWIPLPLELAPANGVPTENLLGYSQIASLCPEDRFSTSELGFTNRGYLSRIQYSEELAEWVRRACLAIEDYYPMHKGFPEPEDNLGILGFLEVEKMTATRTARLVDASAALWSPEALDSATSSMNYLYGLKRRRTKKAAGYCYHFMRNDDVLYGWEGTINSNFAMIDPFVPNKDYGDLESLRVANHAGSPLDCRSLEIREWLNEIY